MSSYHQRISHGCEVVEGSNGSAAESLAHKLDVLALDILDHHDLLFC